MYHKLYILKNYSLTFLKRFNVGGQVSTVSHNLSSPILQNELREGVIIKCALYSSMIMAQLTCTSRSISSYFTSQFYLRIVSIFLLTPFDGSSRSFSVESTI